MPLELSQLEWSTGLRRDPRKEGGEVRGEDFLVLSVEDVQNYRDVSARYNKNFVHRFNDAASA